MRFRLARLIFGTTIFLFAIISAAAQNFHQLTMDDFRGVPGETSHGGVIAYTNSSIEFHYQAHKERNYYRLDFNIQLTLNSNKSWLDKRRVTSNEMLAEILKHEQGHYFIAYMEQQELIRAVSKTVFYSDYQSAAQRIFNNIDAKYNQLNQNYDDDTQHMLNRQQQQSWDAYFKKRLEFMPPA
jgi:hypothetical protein